VGLDVGRVSASSYWDALVISLSLRALVSLGEYRNLFGCVSGARMVKIEDKT